VAQQQQLTLLIMSHHFYWNCMQTVDTLDLQDKTRFLYSQVTVLLLFGHSSSWVRKNSVLQPG
jgi:hypothetical protein